MRGQVRKTNWSLDFFTGVLGVRINLKNSTIMSRGKRIRPILFDTKRSQAYSTEKGMSETPSEVVTHTASSLDLLSLVLGLVDESARVRTSCSWSDNSPKRG